MAIAGLDALSILKAIIKGTDLEFRSDDQIEYCLATAQSDIANLVGADDLQQYLYNQIEGAKWYLARIGVEGETYHSEGGVVRTFASIEKPYWLTSIQTNFVTLRKDGAKRQKNNLSSTLES